MAAGWPSRPERPRPHGQAALMSDGSRASSPLGNERCSRQVAVAMTRYARPRYSKLQGEVRDHVDGAGCEALCGAAGVRLRSGLRNVQSRDIHPAELSHCRRLIVSAGPNKLMDALDTAVGARE